MVSLASLCHATFTAMDDQSYYEIGRELLSKLRENATLSALVDAVDRVVPPFFHVGQMPGRDESLAIALTCPKTAALGYERVWTLDTRTPSSIILPVPSYFAWIVCFGILFAQSIQDVCDDKPDPVTTTPEQFAGYVAQKLAAMEPEGIRSELAELGQSQVAASMDQLSRVIAREFHCDHSLHAVPVYHAIEDLNKEYKAGDHSIIIAALADLPVPDEQSLSWEQVLEFRRDHSCFLKYKRLAHWLDANMPDFSLSYVRDELTIRLADYDIALKKHGVKTVLGTLTSLVDSRALLGGSAAIASLSYAIDREWALVAGGAILVGRAAVSVAKALIDGQEARAQNHPEVAFVAELRSLS